jgi:hypothetical protein
MVDYTPILPDIHDFLVSLAFQAGEIITNALPDTSGTGSKKNSPYSEPHNQPTRHELIPHQVRIWSPSMTVQWRR